MSALVKIVSEDFRSLERRVEKYDWSVIDSDLNSFGCAVLD